MDYLEENEAKQLKILKTKEAHAEMPSLSLDVENLKIVQFLFIHSCLFPINHQPTAIFTTIFTLQTAILLEFANVVLHAVFGDVTNGCCHLLPGCCCMGFQVVKYRVLGSGERLLGSVFSLLGSFLFLLGSRNQLFVGLFGSKFTLLGSTPDASDELLSLDFLKNSIFTLAKIYKNSEIFTSG